MTTEELLKEIERKKNLVDYDIKFNKHNANAVWELIGRLANICNEEDPDSDDSTTSRIWNEVIYPIQDNFEKLGLTIRHVTKEKKTVTCYNGLDDKIGTTSEIELDKITYSLNW